MTHADEYNAEIPQNGNGRSTTKGKKKEKDTRNKGVRKKVKVKKEPKVIAEATITKGADEGAAGCSIPKRLKRLTRFGCPLLNTQTHPPLELPEHEKDTEMQNEQEPRDAPKATRDN